MVKYLIIRFSSIGDIVLTTPLIRCLKEQVADAEIHYLCKPAYASILASNPYIDKLHLLAENEFETRKELKEEGFDYIIDLQNNIRSSRIKRDLKRMYFTIDKLNFKKWLLVNFKINKLPEIHIVDRYLETVKLFDVKNDGKGLDYFIPEKDVVDKNNLPYPYSKGFMTMVIGAQHATKKLRPEKLSSLCSNLVAPIIIIGGPEDKENGEKIIALNPEKTILNGCGKWSVNQSASVIQQANYVITHDTGMMHIAAAFKKIIIAIWGNTIPSFGMYPYLTNSNSVNFEVADLKCRPCSKIGHKECPKKHFRCMEDQDIELIAEKANSI